jgi:hypothetical protein
MQQSRPLAGPGVLTAVVLKSCIFWDITPCRPLRIIRRFGGTCCLHFQDRRINEVRNLYEGGSKQRMFLRNVG